MTRIKIICACCDGKGFEIDEEYRDRKSVRILCRGCGGRGYSYEEKAEVEAKKP